MLDKETQQQKLLRHMLDIGPITKPEARRLYFIENVAQRVAELREIGYNIPNPARKIKTAGGALIAEYEILDVDSNIVRKQYFEKLCVCGKSYYSNNGLCNMCGADRGA